MKSPTLGVLIEKCRDAQDLDSQVVLLREINDNLPHSERIRIPSFITDDYCRRALEIIEDRIFFGMTSPGGG
jgi:hypothetical protein